MAGVVGEHGEVVDPTQVRGSAPRDGVVADRKHGVREYRRRLRPHREAPDPLALEIGEQMHDVPDRRVRTPDRQEPLLDGGRTDRRVAVPDVREEQSAARRSPLSRLEEEAGARREPRLQPEHGTASGRDAVRDGAVGEGCLDGPGYRSDDGGV
jgi:hypothetical protein